MAEFNTIAAGKGIESADKFVKIVELNRIKSFFDARKGLTHRGPWVYQQGRFARNRARRRWYKQTPEYRGCLLEFMKKTILAAASWRWVVLLAVLGGLRLAAAGHLQTPGRPESKESRPPTAEAKKTFESICAGCHGLDGRGGERGPDIATRPEVRARSDGELIEILAQGRVSRGMPAFTALGGQRLRQLLVYLRFLEGGQAAVAIPGDAKRGKDLFLGPAGCSECHAIRGAGGFLGADLSLYANGRSAADIRSAILNVNKDPDPRSRVLVVSMGDGRKFTGMARNEDNFTVQLQTFDGAFHFLSKSEIAHSELQPHTPMPSNYDSLLSPAELDDLVKYLVQVGQDRAASGALDGAGKDDDDE
jgi:cytochrome c oxidase cbb3-type subunit 3